MSEDRILLAHGGGGELTKQLLERLLPRLSNPWLDPLDDAAALDLPPGRVCMTTDAFVVQPLEFPGGDIGRLAVCGTVNDLAVSGARPVALSLALVVEEGLPIALLERMLDSVARAAEEAGVRVCTGDTKVVERGRGDGLTITTAGVGVRPDGLEAPDGSGISAGDVLILSGRIAEHGLAVMSVREGLEFATRLESDVAPLGGLVEALRESGAALRFLRDPTRGGLAGVLADLVALTNLSVEVEEDAIPISPTARHAAELLGLDPLAVANEGKLALVVAEVDAERALDALRAHPLGAHAAVVGRFVEPAGQPLAELLTRAGGRRLVQRPYGEELPRIC